MTKHYTKCISGQQFSPGSFSKAPRNHVPALLWFLTPMRSTKGEFFMKRRLKLLTGYFLKSGSTAAMQSPFFLGGDEENEGKKVKIGRRRWMERTECRETAGVARSNGNLTGRGLFCLCAAMGENQALSASNFHMSISAQLRSALRNQSSRKYP